ncbi:deoxycytidylate deaminase [Cephus cinctus]|uniref:Probable deoxycytidylate deaminase n=1 Tax=Cephus cinctus TaxID=211228 RepID=A0AAJ7FM75_CEPCN|nr:deoxycytidylate deaminase [Cephus cinctus]
MNDYVTDASQEDNEINSSLVLRDRNISHKRENSLDWEDYFMAVAFLSAKRSKDPSTQVGACIVDKNKRIVGIGYNGMPRGCSDDEFQWKKNTSNKLESKYLYVCHAEVNAILNKNVQDITNCDMYVGLFPCNECAKVIIQSGISSIVYMSDKHAHKIGTIAAKRMFNAAGITYRQYTPKNKEIVINFSEIDWNEMEQSAPSPTTSSH